MHLVNATPTSGFPNTWLIGTKTLDGTSFASQCTGTFVSSNTLLTASHCLPCDTSKPVVLMTNQGKLDLSQRDTYVNILTKNPASTAYISGETALCDDTAPPAGASDMSAYVANDLALVVFPDQTSATYSAVDNTHKSAKTQVTMVGYGVTDQSILHASAVTSKNTGQNSLIDTPAVIALDPGIYQMVGPAHPGGANGTNTMPAPGDSGSPLYVGDNIIGVLSGASSDEQNNGAISRYYGAPSVGNYVDLSGEVAARLFARAASIGAVITYAAGPSTQTTPPVAPKTAQTPASPPPGPLSTSTGPNDSTAATPSSPAANDLGPNSSPPQIEQASATTGTPTQAQMSNAGQVCND